MGDLQRLGVVGVAVVPRSQPACALLLPVDPDAHVPVHLEETPLRRGSDNHHALLVRPGLLLLSGKKILQTSAAFIGTQSETVFDSANYLKVQCHGFFFPSHLSELEAE